MSTSKKQIGDFAEALARSWLEDKHFTILESNFLRRIGEIDLIAQHPDGKTVVFVEVRYRSDNRFGGAIASVDYRKQRKLIRTANSWLQKNADSMTPARIDLIAISPSSADTPAHRLWKEHELQWIENAVEE